MSPRSCFPFFLNYMWRVKRKGCKSCGFGEWDDRGKTTTEILHVVQNDGLGVHVVQNGAWGCTSCGMAARGRKGAARICGLYPEV
jgi:hypothetical protein